MKIVLHDNGLHLRFAPLSLTRPIGNLRMGIFTNDERWKLYLPNAQVYFETETYLQGKFPKADYADITVNAALIPNEELVVAISRLAENEKLVSGEEWLAYKGTGEKKVIYPGESPLIISQRWHLYQKNGSAIVSDFKLITSGRKSQQLSKTNTVIGDESLIFIEEGASVEAAILNTTSGPLYIGKHAEIMEGSIVRGPLALCDDGVLKMGAKIYGPTTIGNHCKVGGEVSNSIFQAYSNKGHDGFLGNSLIGEWCNLGADTNTSNLKNNYGNVSTFDYETMQEAKTDIQFMGVCMGDHAKCGINTMFNTASVVGVSSNIFGSGFPLKYTPSFTWGGIEEQVVFKFEKAIEYSNNMMERRNMRLSDDDISILNHLSNLKK
jgi:UDP-N-acetylglucosamine diphosphorylase/glucosamine-1-phosphate N-acetyltransferase